ncbi:IS1182 family transposase [Vagococcus elongatus]
MYKDYNMNQVTLSLDLEIYLEKDDLAFAINDLVESIPEKAFAAFEHQMGATSYHPKMMLKLILCGYTQSIFSGRRIEALAKDSIRARWLTQSQQPNFRTINRFRVHSHMQVLLEECFIQFRNLLVSQNLIETDAIFIDGTKIEANANKYTFVWKKSLQNYEAKLTEKSKEIYHQLVKEKIIPSICDEDKDLSEEDFSKIITALETSVENFTQEIDASHCTEERKLLRSQRKAPKKALKQFLDFKERQSRYVHQKVILGERNSYSKTDPDATFMRMKEDHMRNGQLKAGYNIQIATNQQYVLAYDVFPNPTDTRTLVPFLQTIKNTYFSLPDYIVADAGYGSEENYETIMDDFEKIPLITYGMYRKEKKRSFKKNRFNPLNWQYDELRDTYLCPIDREVPFKRYATRTDKYGYQRQLKMYECLSCEGCSVRSQCTKTKSGRNRMIQKNGNWDYFKAYVKTLLKDKRTGKLYGQRKIDVEPAFGNLKANLGFTRFSVRSKNKVKKELGLAFMAVNLRKLAAHQRTSFLDRQKIRKPKSFYRFWFPFYYF